MSTNLKKIRVLVLLSLMSALSLVLGLIEINYYFAPWLKFDFSELAILITINILGYKYSLLTVLFRSIIRYFITTQTNIPIPFFGESIAILNSFLLIFLFFIFKKYNKNLFLKYLVIILVQTIIITFLNYVFITPSYLNLKLSFISHETLKNPIVKGNYTFFILSNYIPFNLIKNISTISIYLLVSKAIKNLDKI